MADPSDSSVSLIWAISTSSLIKSTVNSLLEATDADGSISEHKYNTMIPITISHFGLWLEVTRVYVTLIDSLYIEYNL